MLQSWHQYEAVPQRRAFLRMLAATWPGWRVRWAHRGLFDVFDHLGLDPELVRDREGPRIFSEPIWDSEDEDDEDEDEPRTIISVRTATGGLELYAPWLGVPLEDMLTAGPYGTNLGRRPCVRLAPGVFPTAGLHVDVTRREAGYWTSDVLSAAVDAPRWPASSYTSSGRTYG